MSLKVWFVALLALAAALGHGVVAAQAGQVIKVGAMCDLTGESKRIGVDLCLGITDYFALINKTGGVRGQRLEYTQIDHAYIVPRAVDAYETLKRDGVVTIFNYGVPILYGLTSRYMEDKIPSFNPGTGRSDAIDGTVWPYIFPGTASYWSQAGAAMKYIKDNGAKTGTKIAFLYFDNPAGTEGIAMMEAVAKKEGYVLRLFAVQPPGLEVEPQVSSITRDFKPDWVIGSLFGRSPAIAIKEFKKAGYPMNRVISFVFGTGEPDVEAAGWDIAQGYLGLQFAALGRNNAVIQDIIKMLRDEKKEVQKYVGSAYYNRGVLVGAVMVEAIRLAIQNHGLPLTGDKVRMGYEAVKNFDAQGLAPPITFTPQDHEGGGFLRMYQVKGNEWAPVTDWMRGYHDDVMALVKKANSK